MITNYICGGLGNQLFQIFTVIAYSYEHNIGYWFLHRPILYSNTNRKPYWDTFLMELKDSICYHDLPEIIKTVPFYRFIENGFEYNKIPVLESENIKLEGYYQSSKYFENYRDQLFELINLKYKQNKIMEMFPIIDFDKTISLHFRLGDYKYFPNIHPISTYKYYLNSIEYILTESTKTSDEQFNILYFHENSMKDDIENVNKVIDNLKSIYPNIIFIEADTSLKDYEQLLLMSLCHHNIISNSTFSWWGAYFNTNYPDKIVTYPSVWFGRDCHHNTQDLCLPSWKCIEC